MSKKEKKTITLNEQVRNTNKVIKEGLRNVARHHVESFDYALGPQLPRICKYMLPVEVSQQNQAPGGALVKEERTFPFKKYLMWFESFELRKPTRPVAADASLGLKDKNSSASSERAMIYPYECRMRGMTYSASLYATVCRKIDDEPEDKITINLGDIPVMVRS
jgi:DNA-directed RNA polymerase beta subunit